jgi:hypothetical protein
MVLLLAVALVGPAAAQQVGGEEVRVRAWQHSDFARIVFDWPAAVGYQAAIEGRVLTVRFERPLEADLDPVRTRLGDYVESASLGEAGRTVRFGLTGPMALGDFTNELSVVLDLRRVAETAEADQAQPEAAPDVNAEGGAPVPLGVRVGEHADYTRIVFDWEVPVEHSVARNGRAVTVAFGRAAFIDVAALAESLPPGIRIEATRPAGAGTQVTFAVPDAARLRDFNVDTRVVLDVLATPGQRNAEAPPLPADLLPAPEQTAQAEPEAPAPADAEAEAEGPAEPPAAETPEEETAAAPVAETAPETAEPSPPTGEAALAEAVRDGRLEFREGLEPDLPDPDADSNAESESGAQTPEPPEPPERTLVPAPDAAAEGGDREAEAAAEGPPAPAPEDAEAAPEEPDAAPGPPLFQYNFAWSEEVGAAVFRRADNIWIIFDSAQSVDLSQLRTTGAPVAERVDQLPISGATVLRIQVPDRQVNAEARREGFTWAVAFREGPQRPREQAPILAEVDSDIGPTLVFPTDRPGFAFNVPDPEMGDVMRIATFNQAGKGMDGRRRYPEFELLPTAQGLAMIRLSDSVLLERNFDGFEISAPDGLAISGVSPEAPVSSGPQLSSRRLFDLERMQRGPPSEFLQHQQALFSALAEVPDEKINEARLDYAGFLMTHGRAREALGVMRVVERDDPGLMARPPNLALKAAAAVLADRTDQALTLLNDPRLDGFAEASLWRGAALAQNDELVAAENAFGPGESLLARYPYPLRATLGLIRIETAFANRNVDGADSWIDTLEQDRAQLTRGQRAALDYNRGRLAVAGLDFDLAEELFREVMASGDRKYAYQAEIAFINMARQQGFMDDEAALERYERLRYAWRGDRSELHLLRKLGTLYLEQPNYFDGLDVYRTAVQYFPGDPVAEDLAGEMTEVFRELFLRGGADELPPLRALALYEEFQELTPAGEDGDRMIENIADRLAAIDLLPEAAEKLETLLADEDRLPPGEERVRLSSKLALIYLMDDKPEQAEEALVQGRRGLELVDLDDALEADRDRLLARAKFQQGEYDTAIKELAGDVSTEADLLRRDIYRETENWQESAKVLQRLAGNPPEDPAEGAEGRQARYVINWGVALYQNDDREGLRDLVDLWGPAMSNSSLSGVFDYITGADPAPTGGNVIETVNQLIGADRFDAFLTAYRDRLFAAPEDPSLDVSATSS